MLKVTIKGLLAHKLRLFTTTLAVMLGVAFLSGTLVLTDTVGKTFDDLFAEVNAGVDAVVRSSQEVESQGFQQRGTVPQEVVAEVAAVDGVQTAEGQVIGFAQLIDKDGEPIGNPNQGAPTFGFNWSEDPQLSAYILRDGEAPGPEEVVIDAASADDNGFVVGDPIDVITQAGRTTLTISGTATFGEEDTAAGATAALFESATAQELLGVPGQFNEIWVTGAEGVSQTSLVASIQPALADQTLEVISGEQYTEDSQDQIAEALGFFNTFLLIFALVAVFVGGFIIYNTFAIIVAQRSREMALLRAVGASRRQVLGSVLIEAFVVGLLASAIGLVVGIGVSEMLKALLNVFGFEIPSTGLVLLPATVIWSFVVGVGVTMFSAAFPAVKASRVPPIAAMRDVALDTSGRSVVRLITGLIITGLGVASICIGLFGKGDNAATSVGLGVFLTFIGVFVLGPALAGPVGGFISAPLPKAKGITGTIARQNVLRNPKRTAATASALMIGIGLVAFIAIFTQSVKASAFSNIDSSFQGDLAIDSGGFGGGFSGIPLQVAPEVAEVPGVEASSPLRVTAANIGPSAKTMLGVDQDMFDIVDVGIVAGDPADLATPGTIAVQEDAAASVGWTIGTLIPVEFAETGLRHLEVVMLMEDSDAIRSDTPADYILGLPTFEANVAQQIDFQVYVKLAPDADQDAARADIEAIVDEYPPAEVQDLAQLKQAQADQVNQLLSLVYALLLLSIIIAALGIANTLALSIYERTRELGLLRAVGMTRQQMRSSVRWEAVVIALLGTALGLGIGLFFSFALQQALKTDGIILYDIPWGQVVVIVVLGALIGVLASIRPARRAARLDVLDAVSTD